MKKFYICQTGTSNKFWSYETFEGGPPYKVQYCFGRIGLEKDEINPPKDKEHPSTYKRENEIATKVRKKLSEGYKEVTEEFLQREHQTSKKLGHQLKITKMEFIKERTANRLVFGKDYFPDFGVVVEITNSWSKEVKRLILSRGSSAMIDATPSTFDPASATFSCQYTISTQKVEPNWIEAIRDKLKELVAHVVVFVQHFNATGRRTLDLGDDSVEEMATAASGEQQFSFASSQVIAKVAALGGRVLDI